MQILLSNVYDALFKSINKINVVSNSVIHQLQYCQSNIMISTVVLMAVMVASGQAVKLPTGTYFYNIPLNCI